MASGAAEAVSTCGQNRSGSKPRQGGARVIEINPNPTHLSELCDVRVEMGARDALVGLEQALEALDGKD